ncbi:MAG: hypothetical protein SO170_10420 [Butyribacter sp.]|nr:hypothetical protein [bacterium]MDY3855349.1 hypothetical protein [Butyribacter sp.]
MAEQKELESNRIQREKKEQKQVKKKENRKREKAEKAQEKENRKREKAEKAQEKENQKRESKRRREEVRSNKKETQWEKLDNTANLFPAIATQSMTNVYRISVTLTEQIDEALLQQALDMVLPEFQTFHVRMRKGIFWYYFETNTKPAPVVRKEQDYPCRFIEQYDNNNYLFRVTYYNCRINLEVFHVLADGMGGVTFLREITYQYLRLRYPELAKDGENTLSDATSLNTEDSYLKNFRKSHKKGYQTRRALEVKGEKLLPGEMSVFHGYMKVPEVKEVCKKYDVTINEYFTAVFLYSIYVEYLHGQPSKKPVVASIPVNLRPYFESLTTRNFFVMVSAVFEADKEDISLENVIAIVKESLHSQINKEHLEDLFSYNVSNQKNIFLRSVPIFFKIWAMRCVYHSSAKANTTTVTNIGNIKVEEKYQKYIRHFHAMLSRSAGQNIKGAICSYQDTLVFTITSVLADVSIQRRFFRILASEGISVEIESNIVS